MHTGGMHTAAAQRIAALSHALTAADIDKLNRAAGQNATYHAMQGLNHSIEALAAATKRRTWLLCGGVGAGLLLVGALGGVTLDR
jgi:hypothetical protein